MTNQRSDDPEAEFSARFRAAVEAWAARRPDRPNPGRWAALISDLAAELHDENIGESTVRGWLDEQPRPRLPRFDKQFDIVLRVLGLRLDDDWSQALARARAARDARSDRKGTSPAPTADPRHEPTPGDAVSGETSGHDGPVNGFDHADTDERQPNQPDDPALVSGGGATSAGMRAVPGEAHSGIRSAQRRLRPSRWRVGVVTIGAVAVISAGVALLIGSGDMSTSGDPTDSSAAAPSPKQPGGAISRASDRPSGGVPCQRGTSAGPPAQSAPRPTAYAPGGAGHAELFLDQRRIVVTDGLGDGCSVILTVRAGGIEAGPWANSSGKTGKMKNGAPNPPKVVDLPWLDPAQRLDFRVCVGEVIDGVPTFQEEDCGSWAGVNQ